mmetsp:Transcript_16312/g.23233  ORF Transcript_16312/g.23233 Transcript_16312/m.23233 type:complete len:212 (+) Transcript_16312:762-1397(+)
MVKELNCILQTVELFAGLGNINIGILRTKTPLVEICSLDVLLKHFFSIIFHVKNVKFTNARTNFLLHTQFKAEISIRTNRVDDASRMLGILCFPIFCQLCNSMRVTDPLGTITISIPTNSFLKPTAEVGFVILNDATKYHVVTYKMSKFKKCLEVTITVHTVCHQAGLELKYFIPRLSKIGLCVKGCSGYLWSSCSATSFCNNSHSSFLTS